MAGRRGELGELGLWGLAAIAIAGIAFGIAGTYYPDTFRILCGLVGIVAFVSFERLTR